MAGALKKVGTGIAESAAELYNKYIDPMVGDIDWHLPDLMEDVPVYTAPVQRTSRIVPARAAPTRAKIQAYHATPHRFKPEVKVRDRNTGREHFVEGLAAPSDAELIKSHPLGRFRMDKIGTGEGAQAYGHGLYFAEEPDVARGYRDAGVLEGSSKPTIGGVDALEVYNRMLSQADQLPADQAQAMYDRGALLEDLLQKGDTLAIEQRIGQHPDYYSPEVTNWFQRDIADKWDAPGSLYQTELNVDPSKMLAWDQTLNDQPEVAQALMPLLQKYEINDAFETGKYPMLGGDIYHRLRLRSGAKDPVVSSLLTDAGIPGIRYLDQGSRTGGGDTENYVIMNPDLIEILKRYRDGGAVLER